MGQGYGYNAYAGIGEESTYGTGVAASVFMEIAGETMKGSRPRKPVGVLGSRSLKRTVKDKAVVGGGIKLPFVYDGLEKILKHAFGTVNTTGANPYTHTFTFGATGLPTGLTVIVNRDASNLGANTMFRYVGCHIARLSLSQEIGEPLIIEPDFIGSDFGNVAIQAATFPGWNPIEYGQMTVATLDQAGTPYDMKLRSLKLVIDNKIEPIMRLLDFKSKGYHIVEQREVTFECEMEFDSITAYAQFRDALEEDYRFKWVSGAKSLQLDLPKAFLTGEEPSTEGPGPYFFKLAGRGEMNSTDNDELQAVLINNTAGPV